MSARSHGGSGSPQIFRDVGKGGIGDDELPKSLILVCSPCRPVVYSSRCVISGHARFRPSTPQAYLSLLPPWQRAYRWLAAAFPFVPLRPCVASCPSMVQPAVVCDAAFQGIHQVYYVFALSPRLRSNGLAFTLLIDQFGQRSLVRVMCV